MSALTGCLLAGPGPAPAAGGDAPASAQPPSAAGTASRFFYIQEYRVRGVKHLQPGEVEDAVYPYLGPGRTVDDVERARAALEKLYRDKGYQAASVQIPPQQVKDGVVYLQASEGVVARLRVRDSRYSSPVAIKQAAPSLAEGQVLNFNDVSRDIVALNQNPDRRVTPSLRTGRAPGTFDVDLDVKDAPPLHGAIELNNRYSANTTHLRLNGSASYTNLWQLGHTLGFNFQIAPENLDDAEIFSGYYLVRLPEAPWLSLMAQATRQNSNISTLGGSAVAGRGETAGLHAIMTLPSSGRFFQSLNLGLDYKHYDQNLLTAGVTTSTPITYWPLSATYSATWMGKGAVTEFNAGPTLGLRGVGSGDDKFDARRSGASGDFIYLRADLAHTHDLPGGFQAFGKMQGQLSSEPLVDTEEFSGGGLGTVRGYLEGEVMGDDGLFGSVELRSPSLSGWLGLRSGEWRFYGFGDAGWLGVRHALPGQTAGYTLVSAGLGTRFSLGGHFTGSVDAGVPLKSEATTTQAGDLRLTFRIGAEY